MRERRRTSRGLHFKGGHAAIPLAAILVAYGFLTSCTPLRIGFPLDAAEGDWQTDGRSPNRDHVAIDEPLQLPLEQAWIYNAGGGFASGSPLVIDGVVMVATRKGEVHVLTLTSGERIGTQEFGRSIEGTPSVTDQILFVPNAWGRKSLDAFDLQTGKRKWRYDGVPIEASVLTIGNLVVVGDVEGNVMGLDQETGEVAWLYEFGELASVLAGPTAVDDRRLVVADETGRVAMLRADSGEEIWRRDLGSPVEQTPSAVGDLVFVPTTRGEFYVLRAADGSSFWEYRVDDGEVRFTSAAVTTDCVIFGGTDGTLRALRIENGSQIWAFHTDGTIAGAPAVSGDIVFVGAMDEKIYAVRRDNGSIQWEASLRGRVKSAPAVRNGYLIVLSEPRYVYAFTNASNIQE